MGTMVFESNGKQHHVVFTEKPLGIILRPQLPVTVDHCVGFAKELGVEAGWLVKSINGQDISKSCTTLDQVLEVMGTAVSSLRTRTTLNLVFESSEMEGSQQYEKVFTRKPLG